MLTTSIIKVIYGQTNITLYRHYDGYLAEGGYELACILKHNFGAKTFIRQLLKQKNRVTESDDDSPLYEIVDSDNEGQVFTYTFEFTQNEFSFYHNLDMKVEKLFCCDNILDGYATVFEGQGDVLEVAKEFLRICKEDRFAVGERVRTEIEQGDMVSL